MPKLKKNNSGAKRVMLVLYIEENRPINGKVVDGSIILKKTFNQQSVKSCWIQVVQKMEVFAKIFKNFSSSIMAAEFLGSRNIAGLRSSTVLYCIEW